MTTIQQYLDYSLLSFAAYGENLIPGSNNNSAELISAKFVQPQIDQLVAAGWEVVDQSSDAKYGSSGFSATLFHNTQTGEYVFANRGTADGLDYLADIWGIATLGLASSQVIDMYRYYKQLITPSGQIVTYSTAEIETLYEIGKYYSPVSYSGFAQIHSLVSTDIGLGKITAAQEFTTVGHSLGGHLSLWLNALIPSNVDHVYTYNGAGQGNLLRSAITTVLGAVTGTPVTMVLDSDVTNIFGYGGPAIIAGVGGAIGQNIPIKMEYKDSLSSLANGLYNHSIVQLTDAISVANLLSQLDINITTAKFNEIFDKGSNAIERSLEGVLDGIRKYFGMTDSTSNDNRNQFFQNLTNLQNSASFQSLIGKVSVVSSPNANEARSDLGLFLSLYYLIPFALKTDGSLTADQQLTLANPDVATQFKEDLLLSQEQVDIGEAYFSDKWIADRVAMLSWINKRNIDDANANKIFDGPEYLYWDEATDTEIQVGSFFVAGLDRRQIKFGDENFNFIEGGSKNDRLYGMEGDDAISGDSGNDLLDGGAGLDTLNGGIGNDVLFGGAGEDALNGGSGNDRLLGGAGADAYNFIDNYGIDIVTDSDGQGSILIDLITANSGTYKLDNIYSNADTAITYTKVNGGNTLIISKAGDSNRVIINNWSDENNLGINLTGSAADPLQATGQMLGDFKKLVNGIYFVKENGNYVRDTSVGDVVGALDLITGTEGNDVIDGGAGSDGLAGKEGNDYILGGADGDHILGGAGKDTIFGGSGDDYIYGSGDGDFIYPTRSNHVPESYPFTHVQGLGFSWVSGYNVTNSIGIPFGLTNAPRRNILVEDEGNIIDGGTGHDFILAGTGTDYVHGGDDNDKIWGMGKSDIIFGDGGNDQIYGDGNLDVNEDDNEISLAMTTPENHGNDIIDGGAGTDYIYGQGGNDIVYGGSGDDALWGDDPIYHKTLEGDDFLYGGIGNDQLVGGGGSDYLDGGDDDDTLFGDDGDDILIGGAGADKFVGGQGADTIYFNAKEGDEILGQRESIDTIIYDVKVSDIQEMIAEIDDAGDPTGALKIGIGGSSARSSTSSNTNNLLSIGTNLVSNKDYYHTFSDGDILNSDLLGNNLNTELVFGSEALAVFGGKLNDRLFALGNADSTLYGGQGDDILTGNAGNNIFKGGAGNDTFVFNTGGGVDRIIDSSGEANTLAFGAGITNEQIKLKLGSFLIGLGNDDEIHIDNFDQNNVLNSSSIQSFLFADGTVISLADFVNRGFDIDGDSGANILRGTNLTDRITGFDGNDVLNGGKGDDQLFGGEGDDTYSFQNGDGKDLILDISGANKIVFGEGVEKSSLAFEQYRADDGYLYLKVSYGSGSDYITIRNGLDGVVDSFQFSDDTSYTLKDILGASQLPLNISGSDEAEVLYGSAGSDSIHGVGGDDILYGQNGNDELSGDLGNDQLYGEDGDDFLDGGQGNDTLIGGAGVDSYAINFAMGNDLAIETINSAENSFLNLGVGLSVSDLEFIAKSNDLEVRIIGTLDSLTIKDYFINPADWKLLDSLGNTHNVADLADSTSVIDDAAELKTYYDKIVSANYKNFLIQNGYQLLNDGTFSKFAFESDGEGSYTKRNTTLQFIEKSYWDNSAESIYFTSSGEYQETHTFTEKLIYQTNVTGVVGSGGFATSGGSAQSGVFLPNSMFGDSQGQAQIDAGDGAYIIKTDNGYWIPNPFTYMYPGPSQNYSAPIPKTIYQSEYVIDAKRYLDTFNFGASDNLFRFTDASMTTIDLGAGNDILLRNSSSSGFETDISNDLGGYYLLNQLLGADFYRGNQFISGSGSWSRYTREDQNAWFSLYYDGLTAFDNYFINYLPVKYDSLSGSFINGNDGNDVINGSSNNDWILGGNGNDYLDGGMGADHYYFFAGDNGVDRINDTEAISELPPNFESFMNVYEAYFYGFKNRIANANSKLMYEREALPDMPVINAMDYEQLRELYDHGVIAVDTVHFGPGISLNDLTLSWDYRALKIVWGVDKGVVIDLPVENDLRENLSLGGYDYSKMLGRGIEKFVFADGTEIGMGELLDLVGTPIPSTSELTFDLGMGEKTNSGSWANKVVFDSSITSDDVVLSFIDSKLILEHKNGNDKLTLVASFPDISTFNPDDYSYNDLHKMFTIYFDGQLGIEVDELFLYETFHTLNIIDPITNLEIDNDFYHRVNTSNGSDNILVKEGSYFGLTINAGAGDDMIQSTSSASSEISAGVGNDTIISGSASDVLLGGFGNDILYGNNGDDYLAGDDGDDFLDGGNGDDFLEGGTGNDLLNGGEGVDTLLGGDGDDIYVVDSTSDNIDETYTTGIDTIQSSVTLILGTNVENLILTGTAAISGTGNELDNVLIGNSANNTLTGEDGNDTLDGGAGTDTLIGGNGSDIYIIDSTADTIGETSTGGIDTVQSSITFTLGASSNLENLTLTGTAAINGTGNSLDNVLVGNSANNTLTGGNGKDSLDGGAGIDTLVGGAGDDTFIIDSTTDTITEYSSGGTDTVMSSVGYTLGAYLENLTITGIANLTGFGNSLNNVIIGNIGGNTLNGWGGIDTLIGGVGNDVYIVDTTTDIIIENVSEGVDTVRSDVSYVLGNNIENLILAGSGPTNGTGNALSNAITGNSNDNILDGGAGTDYLSGGNGNDTYIVDSTSDTIVETAPGGIDTVKSSVTYTLGASSNLENLALTGTAVINGTGNSLTNFLLGNSANNTLTDTAGGNDILQGLGGNDTLNDTAGNNLLDGGVGTDVITSGNGNDLIIGGTGNDTITSGNGNDVLMFNKGDGADTINASVGTDNTLSLGGNFAYSDLSLTKSANDLILKVGSIDQITLKGWYNTGANNKSVVNLQVVAEAIQGFSLGGSDVLRNNKIETFNFANVVAEFDAAGATANWQLTDARLTTHLSSGSDTSAIGGDIAYQYGMSGSLTGVGLLAAQSVINNTNVGQSAQTLNSASTWAAETIKLS